MRAIFATFVCLIAGASTTLLHAQTPAASPVTDIYHVMFVKAAPGQAAALAKQLQEPDPKDPMSAHYLLLRHQEGADWDYCLIQHAGTKASVEISAPPPTTAPPTIAWHDDTFVAGPSWAEFQKAMGLGGNAAGSAVYVVGVHRAVPGHRQQLLEALNAPSTVKPAPSNLTFTHVEGGQWQYLTVTRYASWQELGADRQPGDEGWSQIRQHSAFHNDTITDRVR
jgi:hypothetical protein